MLGAVTHFCMCINHQTMQCVWLHQRRTHIFFERMCKSDSVGRRWLENQKKSVMQLMKFLDVAEYSLHRVNLVHALHIIQRVHVPLHRVGQGENGEEQCGGEFVWVITGWQGIQEKMRGDRGATEGRYRGTERWWGPMRGDRGVTRGGGEEVKYCCFG